MWQCRESAGKAHRCDVIRCGEATRIDVPSILRQDGIVLPILPEARALQMGNHGARAPHLRTSGGLPLGALKAEISRLQRADCHLQTTRPKGHAGSPIQQVEDRQSSTEQTLKRSASNRARCATTGAGGCNPRLRPNPPEGIDLRGRMLGDTKTALGRQCPNVL